MEQDVAPAEPADAAAAFEALRREVALLNVALGGLAAQRASAPDYSETLGEIAQGVSVAIGRLGKVMASPALAVSPTEMARQISAAGDEARRQDRTAMLQIHEDLGRAARDLEGWIARARSASVQNRRLLQMGAVGLLVGAILGVWLPGFVARAVPARWGWPEKMAAHVLGQDLWSAGERMLKTADDRRWRTITVQATKVGADLPCRARTIKPKRRPNASSPHSTRPRPTSGARPPPGNRAPTLDNDDDK